MSNTTPTFENQNDTNQTQNEEKNTDKDTNDIQNNAADLGPVTNEIRDKDVVININNETRYNDGKYFGQRNFMVYYNGKFTGGQELPPGESPLNYDPQSRNGFVRLVFTLVLIMILITAAFNAFVLFVDDMRTFFQGAGMAIALPAMLLMIGLNYAMACSPCTRLPPCNIVCLVLAVIGMSLICAFITAHYDTRIVFYAVIATTAVVFVCLLLAFSSFDFTSWFIYVIVIAVAFGVIAMIASLTMLITGAYMPMVHLGILIVGTLISVIVLTMELQMILGGRAIEIGESDYALAAFLLYTSIVDVFLKLVQMFGILDNL